MLRQIVVIWAVANFVIVGLVSWMMRGWYLGWHLSVPARALAELGLIILPNLILPILVLRYWRHEAAEGIKVALGWKWNHWRSILAGIAAFALYLLLSTFSTHFFGSSIPYSLPNEDGGSVQGVLGLIALGGFILFAAATVIGEETMFRGWIQTQASQQYGVWVGIGLTVFLFGIRHLPADLFYGQIWNATSRMWLAREVDLYLGAILLSLARFVGRSTYASALMHFLLFGSILVQGS